MASIEKGTFYLLLSRFVFFISGYALLFFLGRFLLSPEEFGIFGVVLSIVSLVNFVLIIGIQQAVSKFVSETPEQGGTILRHALKIQLAFSIAVFVLLYSLSDFLALLLNEPSLAHFLRIAAFIPLFQPFFSAIMGYLNGLKKFREQAIYSIFYRTARAAFPIAFALIGWALFGVFAGLAFASLTSLAIAAMFVGTGKGGSYSSKKILLFSLPIIMYTFVNNSFFSIDLLFLKALAPAQSSSLFAGYYTAAQTLSKIPFELATTLSLVLFPLVSETVYSNLKEKSMFYIQNAYRYAFLAVAPCAAIIFSTAPELITLFYGPQYVFGAMALRILSVGFVFMTLFTISLTIISAKGSPSKAFWLALIALAADVLLLYWLVPLHSLAGAALASAVSMLFGLFIAGLYVFKHFPCFPFKGAVKIVVASVAMAAVSFALPVSGLLLIAKYVLLGTVFLAALLLLGEIKKQDLQVVSRMLF